MAKVIWLGEDTATEPGPSFTTCYGGIKFPKDVAVVITDPETLRRARGNLNFKVIEEKSHGESQTQGKEAKEQTQSSKEAKDYDHGKAENTSGYTPVKKRVRKKKPKADPKERTDPAAGLPPEPA